MVDGCTKGPSVAASFELIALLDICLLRREIRLICLSSAALSLLGLSRPFWSSILPVCLYFCTGALTPHLVTRICCEISAWERPCCNAHCCHCERFEDLTVTSYTTSPFKYDCPSTNCIPPSQLSLSQLLILVQPTHYVIGHQHLLVNYLNHALGCMPTNSSSLYLESHLLLCFFLSLTTYKYLTGILHFLQKECYDPSY